MSMADQLRLMADRIRFGRQARSFHAGAVLKRHDRTAAPDPVGPPVGDSSDFGRLFYAHEGRLAHKWHHYLAIYDRIFAPYRQGFTPPGGERRALRFLEIGVSEGGSLQLWRQFFGADAIIFGVDIDPDCKQCDDGDVKVRIGSQADPAFLADVVAEMGGVDVVLDDGSHVASHQRASFDALFPRLPDGGLYAIEDMSTAYWRNFEGGYRRRGTAIEMLKDLVDDLHAWYHPHATRRYDAAKHEVFAVTFFDSIAAIEKRAKPEPIHLQRGPIRLKRTPR